MSLNIDILDVGQGDGIVVWFPNGKTMMVDLGSTKNKGIVTTDSFAYFERHTKFAKLGETLDYLVLTHGDRDHYNMIVPFVEKFRPKIHNVIHGGPAAEYTAPGGNLIDWLRNYMARSHSLTLNTVGSVPKFPYGVGPNENSVGEFGAEVLIQCMGLRVDGTDAGYVKNSKSVVLQIRYPANRRPQRVVTLTGDATRHVEKFILDTYKNTGGLTQDLLRSDILKVAHHGSHRTSNHAEWIRAVNPYFAFLTSDRSGSLDGDQIATGHRLPQHLVLDLLRKYATRLAKGIAVHPYVSSFQRKDYDEYNLSPDIPGEPLPVPAITDGWVQNHDGFGIFSTLASMGIGATDPDQGAQYRIELTADAAINISGTADFTTFNPITGLFPS